MIDLEEIRNRIIFGEPMEKVLEKFDWRRFEDFISEIFVKNDFFVRQNFRFKTKRHYEIDIIAVRDAKVLLVDCKSWSSGRYKKAALKQAINDQKERVKEFSRFVNKNAIAQGLLKLYSGSNFHALIVTLLQEDILIEDDTFVVPAEKLNNFILEIERYY